MTLLIAIMLAVHMELNWQSYAIIVLIWGFSGIVNSGFYERSCYHGAWTALRHWFIEKGK